MLTKRTNVDFFIFQIYVDDIMFGSPNKAIYKEFPYLMTKMFEMSMMWEVKCLLGFQIKNLMEGVFISQKNTLKTSSRNVIWSRQSQAKHLCEPMGTLNSTLKVKQYIKRYVIFSLSPLFTFVHLDQMSCWVCAGVQFKPLVSWAIIWWLRRSLDIFFTPQT